MSDLFYSDDALNVRNLFLEVDSVIYVEGDDDVLFWQHIFSCVTDDTFEVESVGGSQLLDEYIKKIVAGKLQCIAARDSDFLPLTNKQCQNPKVVHTFGYSIENSLYTAPTLLPLVQSWCKSVKVSLNECQAWLDDLGTKIGPLVHLDAGNAISATRVATIHDNCSCYMVNKKSATVCPQKIQAEVQVIGPKIPLLAVQEAETKIGFIPGDVLRNLRGHFLASAVHRYISERAASSGKKTSISSDSLYAAAMGQLMSTLKTTHPHRLHYLSSAKSAWDAL